MFSNYIDVLAYCYDENSKNEQTTNDISTTTEYNGGMFGGFFDENTEDPLDKITVFNDIHEMVNSTTLKISDILTEYRVGNNFGVFKGVHTMSNLEELLAFDWKFTLNYQTGACYTLDPNLLGFDLVPQMYFNVQNLDLVNIYLDLKVNDCF